MSNEPTPTIRPAFRRRRSYVSFALATVFFLAFPFIPKGSLVDRGTLYRSLSGNGGRLAWFADGPLQESRPIDVLFLGHSGVEAGINPRLVKAALEARLGREAVVYVVTVPGENLAFDYFVLRDLLSRRSVKQVFRHRNVNSHFELNSKANIAELFWDLPADLPLVRALRFDQRFAVYLNMVTASFRLLVTRVQDRRSPIEVEGCANFQKNFGACRRAPERRGLAASLPRPPQLPLERLVHRRDGRSPTLTARGKTNRDDRVFSEALFAMAAAHGTKVAHFQVPHVVARDSDTEHLVVPESHDASLGAAAPIIGASLGDLFPGIPPDRIAHRFYIDAPGRHLHHAGADYFTEAIMPAILSTYFE